MLTAQSIENIKSVQLSDIIGRYIKLKKSGSNYIASCPFHNEKSASFSVNDAKEIYKCFGCGKSGGVIQFVIEHENKTFVEACKTIADFTGIELEYEHVEYTEEKKAALSAADEQEKVLNIVVPVYQKSLLSLTEDHPAKIWLRERKLSDDFIDKWQIGWAGSEWRTVTPVLINNGFHDAASKLGIIKRSKDGDSNYDGYRSRITFPIKDKNGRFIGIGGRYISTDANDAVDIPKYINPSECELYNKSTVLYGLSEAIKAIKEKGYAFVTEGYMDVVSPYNAGIENTVATCGTAFTIQQIQLLKRYTSRFIIWRDNDKAGNISFNRAMPDLLKQGIQVEYADYTGKDPDEFIRSQTPDENGKYQEPVRTDGVITWCVNKWDEAGDDIHGRTHAKLVMLEMLANISNEILRNYYFDQLVKKFSWKAADAKKEFSNVLDKLVTDASDDDPDTIKLPEWINEEQKEAFLKQGFVSVNRKINGKPMVGYYTFTSSGKAEITNFLVKPLFHVYAGVESRYMLQIYNGYRHAVLDVPSKNIPSPEQFQAFTVSEGNYLIFGSKPQWLRIASELLQTFPRCTELTTLGWQSFHFFSWVDKIYIPGTGLKDLDNWGIINLKTTTDMEGENFLVPASCEAYRQLQRTGDDPYENDRYLTYKQSPVNFSEWSKQMHRVYGIKGIVAIAYVIVTMFRDLVFDVDNNFPHLYAFGEPSSGKSKWAESMTAVFFFKRSAFNLNSGTDFAFFNYMMRYANALAHLNEFDIEVIKPEWFQAIKGIYDGEGRERGKGGSKNRTEVMRVKSGLILTGQKLVTADDNSVVTRSIIEPFSNREDRTDEDKKAYDMLKEWEGKGLSSMLVELLEHRPEFEKNYKIKFNEQLGYWRKHEENARTLNQRILQNYAHLSTGYSIISEHISLPLSADDFNSYCYKQATHWSNFIKSSDTLSEFWRTLEFLVDQNEVHEGWDYIIESCLSIKIRKSKTEESTLDFEKPTKVLFLRLNNVHKLFQVAFRSRTGKEAMNIENLLHYFTSRKYFLGAIKQKRFKRFVSVTENVTKLYGQSHQQVPETTKKEQTNVSSCYAFVYDNLDMQIERNEPPKNDELPF